MLRAGLFPLVIAALVASLTWSSEALAQAGSGPPRQQRVVPLPKLDGTIDLRVAYLETARSPSINEEELREILAAGQRTVLAHFGKEISFTIVKLRPLEEYVREIDRNLEVEKKYQIAGFHGEAINWERVENAIRWPLRRAEFPKVLAYVRLVESDAASARNPNGLASFITKVMKARYAELTRLTALDNTPLLRVGKQESVQENDFTFWDNLGRLEVPAEVLVTNQLVASVEYFDIPPHMALRGGIPLGGTFTSRSSKVGSLVWLSVFTFLSSDPVIVGMRNGKSYARKDALEFAGAVLAHEIGHQLFHFNHPWDNSACVMAPPAGLDFAGWMAGLNPSACAVGSSREMTPGAARLPIRPPL